MPAPRRVVRIGATRPPGLPDRLRRRAAATESAHVGQTDPPRWALSVRRTDYTPPGDPDRTAPSGLGHVRWSKPAIRALVRMPNSASSSALSPRRRRRTRSDESLIGVRPGSRLSQARPIASENSRPVMSCTCRPRTRPGTCRRWSSTPIRRTTIARGCGVRLSTSAVSNAGAGVSTAQRGPGAIGYDLRVSPRQETAGMGGRYGILTIIGAIVVIFVILRVLGLV